MKPNDTKWERTIPGDTRTEYDRAATVPAPYPPPRIGVLGAWNALTPTNSYPGLTPVDITP